MEEKTEPPSLTDAQACGSGASPAPWPCRSPLQPGPMAPTRPTSALAFSVATRGPREKTWGPSPLLSTSPASYTSYASDTPSLFPRRHLHFGFPSLSRGWSLRLQAFLCLWPPDSYASLRALVAMQSLLRLPPPPHPPPAAGSPQALMYLCPAPPSAQASVSLWLLTVPQDTLLELLKGLGKAAHVGQQVRDLASVRAGTLDGRLGGAGCGQRAAVAPTQRPGAGARQREASSAGMATQAGGSFEGARGLGVRGCTWRLQAGSKGHCVRPVFPGQLLGGWGKLVTRGSSPGTASVSPEMKWGLWRVSGLTP